MKRAWNKKTLKKRAMAMGMAAVLSVGSGAALDTTAIQAAAKNLSKTEVTKSMVVGIGYKKNISVKNIPAKAKVTYTAKNKKIVSVNKKGTITGKKAGSTVIILKLTYNKKSITKKCKVTVKKAVQKVKVAKKMVTVKVGGTYQTKATISPAKSYQKVTYTSSNKKIATVSAKGLVKAKKVGTAQITVKTQDGSGKSVKFTVKVEAKKGQTPKPISTNTPTPAATKNTVQTPVITNTPMTPTAPPTIPTDAPITPTDEPTIPTDAPITPTDEPTIPTDAPITPTEVTKTITVTDAIEGKVNVSGEFDNLIIDSSVGNAEITLDKVTIHNKLILEGNGDYTAIIKDAQIANAEVVEKKVVPVSAFGIFRFVKFALGKRPTLHIQGNTVIINIQIATDVHLLGEESSKVENVSIAAESDVAIAAPITNLKVEETAQKANVSVASKVSKLDVSAPLAVVNVAGEGKVENVAVNSEAEGAAVNISGEVGNIKMEAKTSVLKVEKDAKIEGIQVDQKAEGTKIELAGTVSNVKTEAEHTELSIQEEAKVTSVETSGNSTKIQGSGTVENIEIKGNNIVIEGIGADKLVVDKDVMGTIVNNVAVEGGTEQVVTPIVPVVTIQPTDANPATQIPVASPINTPFYNGGGNTGGNTGANTPVPAPVTQEPTPVVIPTEIPVPTETPEVTTGTATPTGTPEVTTGTATPIPTGTPEVVTTVAITAEQFKKKGEAFAKEYYNRTDVREKTLTLSNTDCCYFKIPLSDVISGGSVDSVKLGSESLSSNDVKVSVGNNNFIELPEYQIQDEELWLSYIFVALQQSDSNGNMIFAINDNVKVVLNISKMTDDLVCTGVEAEKQEGASVKVASVSGAGVSGGQSKVVTGCVVEMQEASKENWNHMILFKLSGSGNKDTLYTTKKVTSKNGAESKEVTYGLTKADSNDGSLGYYPQRHGTGNITVEYTIARSDRHSCGMIIIEKTDEKSTDGN